MILLSEVELGDIIRLTEEMYEKEGWVAEIQPLAEERMKIINQGKQNYKKWVER